MTRAGFSGLPCATPRRIVRRHSPMSLPRPLCLATALAVATFPALHAGSRATAEITTLYVPAFGSAFDGLSGYGVSAALGTEYDLTDSKYDEFAVAQIEGLYLHGAGENTIGGPLHHESLDVGYAFMNLGIGMRRHNWTFAIVAGAGVGGGNLHAQTTRADTALNSAFQVKPRVSYRFSQNWSVFGEYRHLSSSSVFGNFFNDDDRALRVHAIGLGLTYRF